MAGLTGSRSPVQGSSAGEHDLSMIGFASRLNTFIISNMKR
jgi:hypothetical protein